MKRLSIVMGVLVLAACANFPGKFNCGFEFPGMAPTHAEAKREREKKPVLIGGTPVDKSKWPAVVRIFVGNSSCTATVIGKRTILTAAHCGSTGDVATFQTVSGKKFQAKLQRAPGYPSKDLDLNLGLSAVDIDVAPLPVRLDRFEQKGMEVTMIGYGCTQPGGEGGNDGILRIGKSSIAGAQGYDLVLKEPSGSALCYGDSGGPAFRCEGESCQVIAVNSKGNIKDTSYVTRLTLDEANAFLKSWNSPILGVGGGESPQLPPAPKAFKFENDLVKIEGVVK